MKLWKKLSLLTVITLSAAMGGFGAVAVRGTLIYNQDKTLENYAQQVNLTAYSLGRELEEGEIEKYSPSAKRSYLSFLLRRYGISRYILIEKNEVVYNQTPFEIVDPSDGRWGQEDVFSTIQKSGKQYLLLAARKVSEVLDYKLVLVQDITSLYQDIRRQAVWYFLAGFGVTLLAVLFIFGMTRRLLSPLKELQSAAEDISGGNLKRRILQLPADEVGAVACAFNQMAERMDRQVSELSLESERRRQMLGSLAHELKTPMTSLIGYADALLHVKLGRRQQEKALRHIYEESRRLERLSGKLMSLIGLYDNDSIKKQETDMEELFREAAFLEGPQLRARGIKLEISCDMGRYRVDRDLMVSLLVNLIDNALRASREGGLIRLVGKDTILSVQDEGTGIPEEELEHITEAFYVADKARSRREGGAGLGLFLCSRIAELHGARLRIKSRLGEGTEVSLIFPA